MMAAARRFGTTYVEDFFDNTMLGTFGGSIALFLWWKPDHPDSRSFLFYPAAGAAAGAFYPVLPFAAAWYVWREMRASPRKEK